MLKCLPLTLTIALLNVSAYAHPKPEKLHQSIERAMKGSVTITTNKAIPRSFDPVDPFGIFFKGPGFVPKPLQAGHVGSGVLISEDGLILTNSHVLKLVNPDFIKIVFYDGSTHFAELVGRHPDTDIALIKANTLPPGVVPVVFELSPPYLGEGVYAIGNPFNLGLTVTKGVVSAFGRSGLGVARFESFIQTDVAINPGNSGGALFNEQGQVVGINVAIFTKNVGYMGISFAIPAVTAVLVKDQILESVRAGNP